MLKKLIFWSPLFVLLSIVFDVIAHYGDRDYLWMAITASIGWLMYWDALNDLYKYEKESDTDVKS